MTSDNPCDAGVFARACRPGISKPISFHYFAPRCTVVSSEGCHIYPSYLLHSRCRASPQAVGLYGILYDMHQPGYRVRSTRLPRASVNSLGYDACMVERRVKVAAAPDESRALRM